MFQLKSMFCAAPGCMFEEVLGLQCFRKASALHRLYRALYILNWIYRFFTEPNYRQWIGACRHGICCSCIMQQRGCVIVGLQQVSITLRFKQGHQGWKKCMCQVHIQALQESQVASHCRSER